MYVISDDTEYQSNEISEDIFGLNFVLTYDMEFLDSGPLLNLLGTLEPTNLRYPGGSVTETMFSEVEYQNQNWAQQYFSSTQNGVTQRENMLSFVQTAAELEADVQLVLPTVIAFEQSAGQAIASGNYGERREINPEYFRLITDYVREFSTAARENGVEISRLEIGNEFWGAGEMTASEYGYLAASLTQRLARSFPNLDVVAQVSYIAGFFSPVEDSLVYLSEANGDYDIYFPWQDLENIPNLVEFVLPAQGSGVGQTQDIALQFLNIPRALTALDGIVDHLYFRGGFDGIDNERNHGLIGIPQTFLDITGLTDIDTFITEWSVRSISGNRESESTQHTGLQYASSTLEAFFELTQHNVTGANFWPTTFGNENIDTRVLIDTSEQDLTFGGEIFRLLSTNLIGLTPVFDFEISNEIDIHGFSDDKKLVFFASERSGRDSDIQINFSDFSFSGETLVSITYLTSEDQTGMAINSDPIIVEQGASTSNAQFISLDLDPWTLAMVIVQNITSSNDTLEGTLSNDHIAADSGNDIIYGNAGNDRLYGEFGHDTLYGGVGNDSLYGGWGDDLILGGSGDDFIAGTFGNDTLDGGEGGDTIITSSGDNVIRAGTGDDVIWLGRGVSVVSSGGGDDEINFSPERSEWESGSLAVNSSLYSQTGVLNLQPIGGLVRYSSVISGGEGDDTLTLSDGNDAFFLDDQFSGVHSSLNLNSNNGPSNVPRVSSIEIIHAGAGNDLIDLTSEAHLIEGEALEIHGGSGNDTIWGSNANETIFGGDDNDHLFGGLGADILFGGNGSDIFEFSLFDPRDSIGDFNQSQGDLIYIYGTEDSTNLVTSWNDGILEIVANFGPLTTYFELGIDFDEGNIDSSITPEFQADVLVFG